MCTAETRLDLCRSLWRQSSARKITMLIITYLRSGWWAHVTKMIFFQIIYGFRGQTHLKLVIWPVWWYDNHHMIIWWWSQKVHIFSDAFRKCLDLMEKKIWMSVVIGIFEHGDNRPTEHPPYPRGGLTWSVNNFRLPQKVTKKTKRSKDDRNVKTKKEHLFL